MLAHLTRVALLAGGAAALVGVTANSGGMQQTPGSNITVMQCNPHRHAADTPGHPWIDPYGRYHPSVRFPYSDGFLAVSYANDAHKPAREVEFGLVAGHWLVALVKDVGTFSPGARIEHEFSLDREVFPIRTKTPYCAVLRVKYADGTEWVNPRPPDE